MSRADNFKEHRSQVLVETIGFSMQVARIHHKRSKGSLFRNTLYIYNIYHVRGEVVLDAVAEDLVAAAPAPAEHHAAGLGVERHRARPGHRHRLLLDLDRAHLQTAWLAKILEAAHWL